MASAAQLPAFKPTAVRPALVPYDLNQLQSDAVNTSTATIQASDALQKQRNPQWAQALKVGQQDILNDVTGDTMLNPEMQADAISAGIGSSLAAFGDQSPTLTAGSAGSARVSQNLFGTANALDQQIRSNRNQALSIGNQLYPEAQIGLSGEDAAAVDATNTQQQNAWNEANYEDQLGNQRFNYQVRADNLIARTQQNNINEQASAENKANQQSTMIQGGAAIAGVAVLAIAL